MVNLIVSALCELMANMFNIAVETVAPLLGFDFDQFNTAFPFAGAAYSIFQSVALGIVMLVAAFKLVTFFLGGAEAKKTSPIRTGLYTIFAVAAIYYGNYIFDIIMDIAQMPYMAINSADINNTMSINDFANGFANVEAVINEVFYGLSPLLYLIVLLLISIAFIKLLLEAVERYVILFVLVYLSPLASSSLATETTSGIFKRYFTMFLSQCILLILNVWSLKMVCSVFDSVSESSEKVLTLLLAYAFMRIASRLDSYLGQLGLSAAVTGAGLGSELMAAGMTAVSMLGMKGGGAKSFGRAAEAAGAAGGGILGAAKDGYNSLTSFIGKTSVVSGAADAGKNALGSLIKTGKQGATAGAQAAKAAEGGLAAKAKAAADAAAGTAQGNFRGNMHDGWMKTQDTSLWARGVGQRLAGEGETVADLVNDITSGSGVTPDQLHDIANNGFVAESALNALQDEQTVDNPELVGAMMSGISGDKAPEAVTDAVAASQGLFEADNMNFSAGDGAMHADYTKDGRDIHTDVLTAQAYNSLTPEQQSAFTPFRGAGNKQMYYASTSARTPSAQEQIARNAETDMRNFAASGGAAPLGPTTIGDAMRTNRDAYAQALNAVAPGQQYTDRANAMAMLQDARLPGPKGTQVKDRLMSALGDANNPNVSALREHGHLNVTENTPNGPNSIDLRTEENMREAGITNPSAAGYQIVGTYANEPVWGKTQAEMTPREMADARFAETKAAVAANPAAAAVGSDVLSNIRRDPAKLNELANSVPEGEHLEDRGFAAAVIGGVGLEGREARAVQQEVVNNLGNPDQPEGTVATTTDGLTHVESDVANGRFVGDVMTPEYAQKHGVDTNDGSWQSYGIGAEQRFARFSIPLTPEQQTAQNLSNTVSAPAEHPLTADAYDGFRRSNANQNQMLDNIPEGQSHTDPLASNAIFASASIPGASREDSEALRAISGASAEVGSANPAVDTMSAGYAKREVETKNGPASLEVITPQYAQAHGVDTSQYHTNGVGADLQYVKLSRPDTPAEQSRNSINSYIASPNAEPLPARTFANLGRDDSAMVGQYYNAIPAGTEIQSREMGLDHINALSVGGQDASVKGALVADLNRGEASTVQSVHGNGYSVTSMDAGSGERMAIETRTPESFAATYGYTGAAIKENGWNYNAGTNEYFKVSQPRTPTQRAEAELQQIAVSPASYSGSAEPISANVRSELRSRPAMIQSFQTQLAGSGQQIQNVPELGVAAVRDLNLAGENSTVRNAVVRAADNGNVVSHSMDGHTTQISANADNGSYHMTVLDQSAIEAKGFQTQKQWEDAGYTRTTNSAGEYRYVQARYEGPKTQQEQLTARVNAFVQAPSTTHLTAQDWSQVKKYPEKVNQIFDGYKKNGTRVDMLKADTDTRVDQAGLVRAMKIDWGGKNPQSAAATAIEAGEASFAQTSANGTVVEWTQDSRFNRMTVLTEDGARINRLDEKALWNMGYTKNNNNGTVYWSRYEQEPEAKSSESKRELGRVYV